MRLSEEMRSFLARLTQGKTPVGAGVLEDTQKDQQMFQDTRKAENGNGHAATEAKTPRAKQLRWKLKSSGIELMTITPALAEAMLEHNTKNRPLSEPRVRRYAKQMKRNNWRLTRQPIIFAKSGRLQDGQHRLAGVVMSGVSIQAFVAFGDPDENFAFIDRGGIRSGADIFTINGVSNAALMAGATRWLMAYETGALGTSGPGNSFSPEVDELYDFYVKNARLQESARVGQAFMASKLARPSPMTALHYICAQKNRAAADEFFLNIANSSNLKRGSPAWKLHQVLVKDTAENHAKINTLALCAYTIKAWNATRDGLETTHLKWRGERAPDEAFPKAR